MDHDSLQTAPPAKPPWKTDHPRDAFPVMTPVHPTWLDFNTTIAEE